MYKIIEENYRVLTLIIAKSFVTNSDDTNPLIETHSLYVIHHNTLKFLPFLMSIEPTTISTLFVASLITQCSAVKTWYFEIMIPVQKTSVSGSVFVLLIFLIGTMKGYSSSCT
jgi:hypothetical protein